MAKILVLYYSSYGHVEKMAYAVAEGVTSAGLGVDVKRVADLLSQEDLKKRGYKVDQVAPIATVNELPDYDGIIFGTPTRYGNMSAQMKNFLDQTGQLWMRGALTGKVASVFTSTATQHGGQESTILSFHNVLYHLGFILVGLPYSFQGQMNTDQILGGSPYGAATIAGGDGSRQPSEIELAGARFQGQWTAQIAQKLSAGKASP